MNRSKYIVLFLCLLTIILPYMQIEKVYAATGTTIGTSATNGSFMHPLQRKIIYDGTYYWVFYWDNTNVVYRYSSDLVTWSGTATLWNYGPYGRAAGLDVLRNGTKVIVATGSGGYGAYYAEGIINSTTITWGATRTIFTTGYYYFGISMILMPSGRVFVFFHLYDKYPTYYYTDNAGVSWATVQLTNPTISASTGGTTIVNLLNSEAMSFLKDTGNVLYSNKLTGTVTWSALSSIATGLYTGSGFWSTLSVGDIVHVVWKDASNLLWYKQYNDAAGTWGILTQVYVSAVAATSNPILQYDVATTTLYLLYITGNKVNYFTRPDNTGDWDINPTELSDETTDTITDGAFCTAPDRTLNGYLIMGYVTKAANPWNVKIRALAIVTYTATYYLQSNGKLYIASSNIENGTVKTYVASTSIVLMALPNSNYTFIRFLIGAVSQTANPYTHTIVANIVIWVHFGTLPTLSGNAIESDVKSGKTFYNNSTSTIRTGTLVLIGNATESDVLWGQTFYNDDFILRYGTYVAMPPFDFADGNATESDVLWGQCFYNNSTEPRYGTYIPFNFVGNATEAYVFQGYMFYNNSTVPRYGAYIETQDAFPIGIGAGIVIGIIVGTLIGRRD